MGWATPSLDVVVAVIGLRSRFVPRNWRVYEICRQVEVIPRKSSFEDVELVKTAELFLRRKP